MNRSGFDGSGFYADSSSNSSSSVLSELKDSPSSETSASGGATNNVKLKNGMY